MSVWKSFKSLYFATLLMLLGSGLLSTYLALHVAERADGIWVGALMTGFYLGLVLGGKLGHRLIARVGHIRTYVASAGIVTAAVLLHGLTESLPAWLSLRVVVGLGMMSMYMVVESWLNEQSTSDERGMVFSGYMMASYLGMVLGQLVLAAMPDLNINLLLFVALCFSLCLVPVALTRRIHPEPLHPAPLEPRYFLQRVPLSMLTSIVAGAMVGAFYGLAPLYASRIGLPTQMIGLFMATCIVAGLLVQGPLGWLSDRLDRPTLIRVGSALLMLIALPQAIFTDLPIVFVFIGGSLSCMLLFSLYPLAVAFANDNIEAEKRVSLTAVLLTTFGIGASISPLLIGVLMKSFGPNMLYVSLSLFAMLIVIRVRPQAISGDTLSDEAPLQHIYMPDGISSSPLAAALDPRVEESYVQEQMQDCALTDVDELSEEQHY
ncbi:MAG: MFS transporter [Thiopseudomonas sp.]|jgi:MFS family permease|nr:MFS transporter [Thiopseudomonas sp.]MBP7997327.1 MFS transporter [Thiopseudomonas sp.]MBP8008284.1 MFS transporter [Thiopseudomonas sp.]MBP8771511.1 MFS transporter [Thiopseudomonas sp.]